MCNPGPERIGVGVALGKHSAPQSRNDEICAEAMEMGRKGWIPKRFCTLYFQLAFECFGEERGHR